MADQSVAGKPIPPDDPPYTGPAEPPKPLPPADPPYTGPAEPPKDIPADEPPAADPGPSVVGERLEQAPAPQAPTGGLRVETTPTGGEAATAGETTSAAPQAPGPEGDTGTP